VLKRRIMDPIGGSSGWKWDGYRNSTVTIDGRADALGAGRRPLGGGFIISARDLALMGLLVAKGGAWNGTQILPKGWTDELVKPCPVAKFYGLMWWLKHRPAAVSRRPPSAATSRWAGAATSSGSIRTTISSRCCAGSIARKRGFRRTSVGVRLKK